MFLVKSICQKSMSFVLVSLFVLGTFNVMAQNMPMQNQAPQTESISDGELKQFDSAAVKVMYIQEESQEKMMLAIEENDLSLDRFNELLMEGQQGGQESINASEEELAAFNESMAEVQTIQNGMQTEMMEAISEEGLGVDKYQQIMQAYEQDEALRNSVDQYIAEIQ